MNFSSGRYREEPEISLTSLIDVVFTLIIFFVVTTTFDERSALALQLPEASTQEQVDLTQPLLVIIDAEGRYFVGNEEVLKKDADSLRRAIEQQAGDDRERAVTLRADARTEHQRVITALDVLRSLGFARVQFATTAPEPASP
jgi:biopolymer transport protein ExbD